jgi:plasmid stabilization system protein ParE
MTNRNLIIIPEAERDVSQGYGWYENQEIGLGEEFLRCVDACIQSVRRNPAMYQIAHINYRRAVIRRFPYVVFYEYSDKEVVLYAVFHCSQNPKKWLKRLL